MFQWNGRLVGVFVALLVTVSGCEKTPLPKDSQVRELERPANVSETGSDPAEVVRRTLDRLSSGQADAIWDFLPSSYQDDLNGLCREFASGIEPEVWQRSLVCLKRLQQVLSVKKDWVLDQPEVTVALGRAGISREQFSVDWDFLLGLLDRLLQSPLVDLEELRTFDGRRFLLGPGTVVLSQLRTNAARNGDDPFAQLKSVHVVRIRSDSRLATVSIATSATNAKEYEFVKVEGKWIPATWLKDWDHQIAAARQELSAVQQRLAQEHKETTLAMLDRIDEVLQALTTAQTRDAFRREWDHGWSLIRGTASKGEHGVTASDQNDGNATQTTQDAEEEPATVILKGRLDEATLKAIDRALENYLPQSEVLTDFGVGSTTFVIERVSDLDELAQQIPVGRVVEIDSAKRVIQIELAPQSPSAPKRSGVEGE